MKLEPTYPAGGLLARLVIDPWLMMLAIGGLGHQLGIPFLLRIGFWNVWLVVFIVDCIVPLRTHYKLKLGKEEDEDE